MIHAQSMAFAVHRLLGGMPKPPQLHHDSLYKVVLRQQYLNGTAAISCKCCTQALGRVAETHGVAAQHAQHALPLNAAFICWQWGKTEGISSILALLAGLMGLPSLPQGWQDALACLGKTSSAASLSDLLQVTMLVSAPITATALVFAPVRAPETASMSCLYLVKTLEAALNYARHEAVRCNLPSIACTK